MNKVLIIGGSGLLGSSLVPLFDDAFFTYNNTQINESNAFRLDISDRNSLKFLLKKLEPNTIIVTAALTDVEKCEIYPEIAARINSEPFQYLVPYLKKNNGRLIQISTDYVFSGDNGNYGENDARNPVNMYGKTKMDAENIIIGSGINYTIIRTSGIFGANEATGKINFFTWLYNNLKNGNKISLVTDQFYSPVLNTILSNSILEIFEREISGIIHFSSSDRISRFEFGTLTARSFRFDEKSIQLAKMEDMKWKARRPMDSSLNNNKAMRELINKPVSVSEEIGMIKKLLENEN